MEAELSFRRSSDCSVEERWHRHRRDDSDGIVPSVEVAAVVESVVERVAKFQPEIGATCDLSSVANRRNNRF